MSFNEIRPFGPHITGFVRIARESTAADARQLDHFEILDRVHGKPAADGTHPLDIHPIAERLGKLSGQDGKIREIPVHLMFNRPENNLSSRYEAFDTDLNRHVCSGDGLRACRASVANGEVTETACVGPDCCDFANSGGVRCGMKVRLKVKIDGQDDPLAVFEVQSAGVNSFGTISAKLAMMYALFGDRLRHVPLRLSIWTKSSVVSSYLPFQCVDLQLADATNLNKATMDAADLAKAEVDAGLNFEAMEEAVASMRKQAPLSLDDLDEAVLPYLHRARARKQVSTELAQSALAAAMTAARQGAPESSPIEQPFTAPSGATVNPAPAPAQPVRVATPPIEF